MAAWHAERNRLPRTWYDSSFGCSIAQQDFSRSSRQGQPPHACLQRARDPLRARPDRAGDGAQPLLPGAALLRHGACPPASARGDAGGEGGGRLGSRLHRGDRDPSELGPGAGRRAAALGRARRPRAEADDGRRARPRGAGRDRARPQRPARPEPLHAHAARGLEPHVARHRPAAAGACDGPPRHPRAQTVACARRPQRRRGRLRHRLRLRRPPHVGAAPLPVARAEPAGRRVRRLAREPRAADARAPRGRTGRCRRTRGHRDAAGRGRRGGRGRDAVPRGGAGGRRAAGRDPGPLGRERRGVGERLADRALRARGGVSGRLHRLREVGDDEARGGRRALHLSRPDGLAGAPRRARPDRRGAALDRRSVPAREDQAGPRRRDPRVHRLQRLRGGRQPLRADPLHAEPLDGRGVAPRMAS